MRVAFCAIAYSRDPDHAKLTKMLDSAKAVGFTDFVIGVDRKSVAGTEDFIRSKVGGDVFPFTMERADGEVDFGAARNLVHARIPAECDWWGWADADDEILSVKGQTIPEFLASIEPGGSLDLHRQDRRPIDAVFFPYDYQRDAFENQTTNHTKGRLYRRTLAGEWRDRLHEDFYPIGRHYGTAPTDIRVLKTEDDFIWKHDTTGRDESYGRRNLPVLKLMVAENPNEPRYWYYLANQYFNGHDWLLAAETYEKYVSISTWPMEKWNALVYLAIAYRSLSLWDKALDADDRAMHLIPELPDSYFGMGETYCRIGEFEKAIHFGRLGLERVMAGTLPDNTVFFNTLAYSFSPYIWMGDAYFFMGDMESAIAAFETAAKVRPEPDLLKKIEHMKWAASRERIIKNGLDLAAGLLRRNEPLKAKAIVENLPAGASERRDVQQVRRHIGQQVAHLSDDIAYRNSYFRSEAKSEPLSYLDMKDGGMPRVGWALRKLKNAKRILQVGVGDGLEGLLVAKNGTQVVGIDINPLGVKEANWSAVKAGFMGTQSVRIATDEEAAEEGIEAVIETPDMRPDAMFRAFYSDVRKIDSKVMDMGPFDAVMATELIEHVPDVDQMLDAVEKVAPRVILSTPDGAYDGPQVRHQDHVRAYSLKELASLLTPRGAVVDLHRVKSGPLMADNIVAQYLPGKQFRGPQVTIFCGNTGQGWTPDSIREGGIGGSETAVIRVAEGLAARGFRVKVWAECEGIWNNVSYSLAEDFVPWECDLYVSWRSIAHQDTMKGRAARRFVWAHDVHFGEAIAEQLEGVTVLALSKWHAGYLREKYPTADIVVSGNGIDPERFVRTNAVQRIPHRLIYAQSPDRGLDVLLKAWPEIRAMRPDAELHVFYGFDLARQRLPEWTAQVEMLAKQGGVTLHGRIDQEALAAEYLKADALLYPALMPNGEPFAETYCISVVEAQAAGCMPITPTHGALGETNARGIHAESMKYQLRELADWWSASDAYRERRRGEMREWAVQQDWGRIADQWGEMLIADAEVAA